MKIFNITNLLNLLFLLIPITLVIGPAIADINIVLMDIFFLILCFQKKLFHYFKNKFFVLFLLWNLYIILLSIFSDNMILSFESSLFYFRFGIFAVCIYHICNIHYIYLKYFLFVLSFVLFIVTIDAWIQFFYGFNLLGYPYNLSRLSGFFNDEYILGSFLSRMFPLYFGLIILFYSKSLYALLFSIFLFISIDCLIYISGERTAFLFIFISTFLILILNQKWRLTRLLLSIVSIFLIIILSFIYTQSKSRMVDYTLKQTNLLESTNYNFHYFSIQHEVIFNTAIKIFKDNILFGIGPKMFREKCKIEKYQTFTVLDGSVDGCSTHPHHTYIQLLTETGITGLIPIIFIFLFVCSSLFKQFYFLYFKNKRRYSDFQISLFICIFISLFPLAPSGNFFNSWLSIIYYLPIGMLFNSYNKQKDI